MRGGRGRDAELAPRPRASGGRAGASGNAASLIIAIAALRVVLDDVVKGLHR
jgi:hypothetical protein